MQRYETVFDQSNLQSVDQITATAGMLGWNGLTCLMYGALGVEVVGGRRDFASFVSWCENHQVFGPELTEEFYTRMNEYRLVVIKAIVGLSDTELLQLADDNRFPLTEFAYLYSELLLRVPSAINHDLLGESIGAWLNHIGEFLVRQAPQLLQQTYPNYQRVREYLPAQLAFSLDSSYQYLLDNQ